MHPAEGEHIGIWDTHLNRHLNSKTAQHLSRENRRARDDQEEIAIAVGALATCGCPEDFNGLRSKEFRNGRADLAIRLQRNPDQPISAVALCLLR
jgi:hypothetical protein